MRAEIGNFIENAKYQAMLKGPEATKRGILNGVENAAKLGVALSYKFAPSEKKEPNH